VSAFLGAVSPRVDDLIDRADQMAPIDLGSAAWAACRTAVADLAG